jgi:predicted RecB family nuclease
MKTLISHICRTTAYPIVNLREIEDSDRALVETRAAMQSGVEAIAQATLASGRWFGRSDVLRRVERPSELGSWSYEVYDCKLACETRLQQSFSPHFTSQLLESVQGVLPELMYVVPPGVDFQPEKYRVLDFAAYYRFVKARLERAVGQNRDGITTVADEASTRSGIEPPTLKLWRPVSYAKASAPKGG